MSRMLSYQEKNTWIHRLCGVSKLVFFLLWSVTSMVIYDTRVLAVMLVLSFVLFKVSKTEWHQISTVFKFILLFMSINLVAIFFFSPYQGCEIYGTRHVLCHLFWRYDVTVEQLFYELNVLLKYLVIVPTVFLFMVSTDPSEFAASLNRVGVSYKVGYSVALALRYIPDVQDDFRKIKNAQSARGIEMSAKAPLSGRIKNTAAILFPLIFSSMDRIDVVANAMELRGFGKNKKRTWYAGRPLRRSDFLVIAFSVAFSAAALAVTFADGSRFWTPPWFLG